MTNPTLTFRELAERAAQHPGITDAVNAAIRSALPGVVESVLRDMYPGETLRLYVPKRPMGQRRERDRLLRSEYNGRNAVELGRKYGVSPRTVWRAVQGARTSARR